MNKSILIARSNIRSAKGQAVSITVLMLIAAAMFNLWLMLSTDYKANFERYHDRLNAEHVTLTVDGSSGELRDFLSRTAEGDGRTAEYRLDDCMHMVGTFPYNGGEINLWSVFMEKQAALTRSIGKIEIVEDSGLTSGIYMPMLYRSEDIFPGSVLELSIGSHTEAYTVCGFFNSVMMGSHNCTLTQIIMTKDKYDELEASGYASRATLCSVRLTDSDESLGYEAQLKSAVSERYPGVNMVSNSYETVSVSRYISQMICSGVMAAMAFFVLLIAIVVISSNIVNYIQVSMKSLGALKSVGYTSGQLICSLLMQFLSLSLIAAAAGIGLSYCAFPAVNRMMAAQTGIPYAMRFLPLPAAVSVAALCGAVALAVWLSARRIKRIEPITALRSGIQTHSFRRNRIPLEKSRVPLNLALALKATLSGVKHNITVCVTMLVLSLVIVFSGLMFENFIADMTPFLNLVAGETADSAVSVRSSSEEDLTATLKEDSRVESFYLYTSLNVAHTGGAELLAYVCEDFSKLNNQNAVFAGRFPKYDNEIAIAAKYAGDHGLDVGDEIDITANESHEKYLICGFTQISNNLGRDCMLTREGYERLGAITEPAYYINLTGGTDIEEFNLDMEERLSGTINATLNIEDTIKAAGSVYVMLMTIIVAAVLVLSAVIIVFVLYLLVRTTLNNRQHDYGVMKALGFTTGQLILQTALSFMPSAVLSTAAGLVLNSLIINPLMSLFLSSIGIVRCAFSLPAGFIAVGGAGLVVYAFAAVCLLSLKIRRIAPRALLSGE